MSEQNSALANRARTIIIVALLCLTAIGVTALLTDHNGAFCTAIVAAIAAIAAAAGGIIGNKK